jgi:hypothetical protein
VKRNGLDPEGPVRDSILVVQADGCIRNVGGASIPSESQLVELYVFDCSGNKILQASDWTNTASGDQWYAATLDAGQHWVFVNGCLANVYDCDPANPPEIVEEDGNWWDIAGTGGTASRCFRRVCGPTTTNIGEYYGTLKNTNNVLLKNRVMRWTHPAGWYVYTRSNNDGCYFAAFPGNPSPYIVEIAGPANTAATLHVAQESPFLVQKAASPQLQHFTRT